VDYRDPLFSVIVFFVILFIAVLLSVVFGNIREYMREKNIKKFFDEFEYVKIENLSLDKASADALYHLAKAYEKDGDFEKSLKIYLWISKNYNSIDVLKHIARVYYKAGFLEKAKKIAYRILSAKPRDIETLKLLLLVDEKMNNLKEIIDILEIFDELEVDFKDEKAYALYKLAINNKCSVEFCEDALNIDDVYEKYPIIQREYLSYLFNISPKKAYALIPKNKVFEYLDLFWERNDIPFEDKYLNVLAAKHMTKCDEKAPFEIEVLKNLNGDFADLEFEYVCGNCKKIFPLYSSRCPNCNRLFTHKLILNLVEKDKEFKAHL